MYSTSILATLLLLLSQLSSTNPSGHSRIQNRDTTLEAAALSPEILKRSENPPFLDSHDRFQRRSPPQQGAASGQAAAKAAQKGRKKEDCKKHCEGGGGGESDDDPFEDGEGVDGDGGGGEGGSNLDPPDPPNKDECRAQAPPNEKALQGHPIRKAEWNSWSKSCASKLAPRTEHSQPRATAMAAGSNATDSATSATPAPNKASMTQTTVTSTTLTSDTTLSSSTTLSPSISTSETSPAAAAATSATGNAACKMKAGVLRVAAGGAAMAWMVL